MNIFYEFFNIYQTLTGLKQKHQTDILPSQPWFGIGRIDQTKILGHFREMARSILLADQIENPNVKCFGFKEIRYHELGERLVAYLDFLSNIFPEPAFILNTRNLDDVVSSSWWAECDSNMVRKLLSDLETRFGDFALNKSNCFHISYENVIAKEERLKEMFEFLGAPYLDDRIETVLSTPHSYAPTRPEIKKLFQGF